MSIPEQLTSTGFRRVEHKNDPIQQLADIFSSHVIGQEEAAYVAAREIIISEGGMADPAQPEGVLMFTGPTGTGKTELTEVIAKVRFGGKWKNHYKKIDCNLLNSKGNVTKLTGSGPEWIGYGDPTLITPQFVDQPGGSIIVFDEVEKAHEQVWEALLSITDKGTLEVFVPSTEEAASNAKNKKIEPVTLRFSNTMIIFTSNAGSQEMQQLRTGKSLGFVQMHENQDLKTAGLEGLKKVFQFMPEFLGRIGESRIVVFNDLKPEHYSTIFDVMISNINKRISGEIIVGPELKAAVLNRAIGVGTYGARDLRNTINECIVAPIAELRASDSVSSRNQIYVDYNNHRLEVYEGPEVASDTGSDATNSAIVLVTEKPAKPTPKDSIEFQYNTPFTINPPDRGDPTKDGVVSVIELYSEGKRRGKINFREIDIKSENGQIIYPLDNKLYRMEIELEPVLKSQVPTVTIRVNNQGYIGNLHFGKVEKGLYRIKINTWLRWEDTKKNIKDLVFSWNDIQEISFHLERRKR